MPFLKILICSLDFASSIPVWIFIWSQPVANFSHNFLKITFVRLNVTSSKVRYRYVVAIPLLFKHEYPLSALLIVTVLSATKINSKLERHVQPCILTLFICLTSTKVVDRVLGRTNEALNFVNPGFAGIIIFGSNSGTKAKIYNGEQNRLQ